MKVFIDTSAFCALAIPHDKHNDAAKSHYTQIHKRKALLYTSDYVLDETYTLLKMRGSHETAVKFMTQLETIAIILLSVTDDITEAAKAIFRKFEDRKLSYTDCTSFALINHFGINAVFAFDDHFRYHPYKHPVKFLG
ncbi:MAG: PIN domain-containing protein [Pseudomonadota bacterium]